MGRIIWHQGLIASAAVRMRELRGPKRNSGWNAQGMGRKGMFKEHPFARQAFHRWCLAKGIAVEVTGGGFLLICHDH